MHDTKFGIDWSAATFYKARQSASGDDCVEFATKHGHVALRDSKNPNGGLLVFTANEWAAFTKGVENGEFPVCH